MSPVQEPHVLIIGAGLTGLLIAHGLAKHDIPYTLFESESENTFRPKEWSMGIHWGVPLMENLLPAGIMQRLVAEATVDPSLDYGKPPCNGSQIYDGVSGKVLKELGGEGRLLRVSRRRLRKLCAEGVRVRYGCKLKEVVTGEEKEGGGVEVVFENGERVTGTVVVGADGPRSTARRLLFAGVGKGEEAEVESMKDMVHLANTICYHDATKAKFVREAHPVWSMALSPQLFVYLCTQDARDPEKPEEWTFYLFLAWKGDKSEVQRLSPRELMELVKGKAKGLQQPFRSAIEWIPEGVVLERSEIGFWIAREWDTKGGRITLAGDAAHPMPPYRGQGLNHAIQDAHNFVHLMHKIQSDKGAQQQALVNEYSKEVANRGSEETKMSTKNGYMLVGYDEFMESPYMKHGLTKQ